MLCIYESPTVHNKIFAVTFCSISTEDKPGVYICIKISPRHQVLTWKKWQHEDFNFKYLKISIEGEGEGCL